MQPLFKINLCLNNPRSPKTFMSLKCPVYGNILLRCWLYFFRGYYNFNLTSHTKTNSKPLQSLSFIPQYSCFELNLQFCLTSNHPWWITTPPHLPLNEVQHFQDVFHTKLNLWSIIICLPYPSYTHKYCSRVLCW